MTSFLANHAAMFLRSRACGSECCSSNSNAPDISQKGLIGIQSHHSREKMSKKAREKPAEAGSASVSPYGSVLGYELVTSQPNRLINLIWPECRTWFIGPWIGPTVPKIRRSCVCVHVRRCSYTPYVSNQIMVPNSFPITYLPNINTIGAAVSES